MANKGVHHEACFSEIKYYHIKTDFYFYGQIKTTELNTGFISPEVSTISISTSYKPYKNLYLKMIEMNDQVTCNNLVTYFTWVTCGSMVWFLYLWFWVNSGIVRALWRIKTTILQIGMELDRCSPILIVDMMVDFIHHDTRTHSTHQTPNSIY